MQPTTSYQEFSNLVMSLATNMAYDQETQFARIGNTCLILTQTAMGSLLTVLETDEVEDLQVPFACEENFLIAHWFQALEGVRDSRKAGKALFSEYVTAELAKI